MILPVAKLGTLVLRTISKPLASRLKSQAARHPRFRESIVSFAQANHKFQVNVQRQIYGHATDVEINPLNEEKAVQAASDFVGEFVIFTVGGGVLVFEVQRGARSEARKEEAPVAEIEGLRQQVGSLAQRLDDVEKAARGSSVFQVCCLDKAEKASELNLLNLNLNMKRLAYPAIQSYRSGYRKNLFEIFKGAEV